MTTSLPITPFLPAIFSYLSNENNLILQAEPGAGKSTAVPLYLLLNAITPNKKIILLEPRRVAAKSIAYYLAKQLNESVGERVGYRIRNDHNVSSNTQLEIVTEGVLTRMIQQDPELADTGVIIFDEFHERSLHADLALLLAKEVQEAYRDDLKIMVMSATIDPQPIAKYLGGANILACPGRCFPVDISYVNATSQRIVPQVFSALEQVFSKSNKGDVLVFLPGQGDIKKCLQLSEALGKKDILFLPMYGALPIEQQQQVLAHSQGDKRRVIFSTNIAETSLTIEGISWVIDSGQEKIMEYDVKSGLSRLTTTMVSKASATQRAGRAGRLSAGHCIRLWTESKQQALSSFQSPEIMISDLSSVVLELAAWGIVRYQDALFLSKPSQQHFDVAQQLLKSLALVDDDGQLTKKGEQSLMLGIEPRLASMMLSCQKKSDKQLAVLIAALVAERDILIKSDTSCLVTRLHILMVYKNDRKLAKQQYAIHVSSIENVIALAQSFARKLSLNSPFKNTHELPLDTKVGELLLHAFPDRLAQSRGHHTEQYLLANGRGVTLNPHDPLANSPWLVVADCDGQNKDGKIYLSATINFASIEQQFSNHITYTNKYFLDDKKEKILARELAVYRSITLQSKVLNNIPSQAFQTCIRDIVKSEGLTFLQWTPACERWLLRCQWLGQYIEEFASISTSSLVNNIDEWLLPFTEKISTIKQLKALPIERLITATISWQQSQTLDQHAPTAYQTPSGKKVTIRYDPQQNPTVSVVLQEMFGELTSPLVARGQVPLRFELLSPAKRPIQTTSDLATFWQSSYFEVAKDMRGQYPKHRWPEKPLEELPGRSIKRRKK